MEKTVERISPPVPFEAYTHIISPLSPEDGGGFLLTIPDLPGCMADGETEEEALAHGRDAFAAVVSALADMGREIPAPTFSPTRFEAPTASGRFVTRLPRSIHARLVERARSEGVSLNALVLSMVSEGLGSRARAAHGR
ncbi:MAG: type II toxin-antitoxin system HicB family antitoxin [Azoarcus sp.]|jgi:predicted RNase H-like HicB family nuclease|nr:type II toxin-antitoxin system HicB family antitoxin [Azoarcus sp.]